jgi:hypothetical protein
LFREELGETVWVEDEGGVDEEEGGGCGDGRGEEGAVSPRESVVGKGVSSEVVNPTSGITIEDVAESQTEQESGGDRGNVSRLLGDSMGFSVIGTRGNAPRGVDSTVSGTSAQSGDKGTVGE